MQDEKAKLQDLITKQEEITKGAQEESKEEQRQ